MLSKHLKRIIFPLFCLMILLAFCTSSATQAQEPAVQFNPVPLPRPRNTPVTIVQDTYGFMWIGTWEALYRYDGYNFIEYIHSPEEHGSIPNSAVFSLLADRKEPLLWIGSDGGGLIKFDLTTEKFTSYPYFEKHPSVERSGQNVIKCLHQDRDRMLWLGTTNGLLRFDPKTETVVPYLIQTENTSSSRNVINSIYEDHTGHLWIGTSVGLYEFERNHARFRAIPKIGRCFSLTDASLRTLILNARIPEDTVLALQNDLKEKVFYEKTAFLEAVSTCIGDEQFAVYQKAIINAALQNKINAIYEDSSRILWVGTDYGLYTRDSRTKETSTFLYIPDNPASLSHNTVTTIHEDKYKDLWIGTREGLDKLERETNRVIRVHRNVKDGRDSSENTVTSVYADRSGLLWLGYWKGKIYKERIPRKKQFAHHRAQPRIPNQLRGKDVYALYQDRQNPGVIWVGTEEGLNKFDPTSKLFTLYSHNPGNPQSLGAGPVQSICQGNNENLWIGTDKGLTYFSPKNGIATTYLAEPENSKSLSHHDVRALYQDSKGKLWIGTFGGGLNTFDPSTQQFARYTQTNGLTHDEIRALYADREETLWIGTSKGISRYSLSEKKFSQPEAMKELNQYPVTSLYANTKNQLWIGTEGGGLYQFDPRSEKILQRLTEEDGVVSNNIAGILEDKKGHLWISTDKGLSECHPELHVCKNYIKQDGLQILQFSPGAYERGRNGDFLFGGKNGFHSFRVDALKAHAAAPPSLALTTFQIGYANAPLDVPVYMKKEFILSTKDSAFAFEFAALDYADPDRNIYAYKLEDIDDDWRSACSGGMAQFMNLDPGKYTLRLKAANNDFVWNEEGMAVDVVIKPQWWETWIVKILFWLFIIMGIGTLLYFRQRHVEQIAEIEKKARIDAEHMAKRLNAVNKIGQRLNADIRLSEQEILELIYNQTTDLMKTDNMFIALCNIKEQKLRFPLVVREGERLTERNLPAPREFRAGFTEHVIKTGKSLFLSEKVSEWCQKNNVVPPYKPPTKSWMGVLMKNQEKVLGVLALFDPESEHVYDEDDFDVLQAMVGQAAIAITNIRIYEKIEQKWMKEKEKVSATERLSAMSATAAEFAHRMVNLVGTIPVRIGRITELLDTNILENSELIKQLNGFTEDSGRILKAANELKVAATGITGTEKIDINELLDSSIKTGLRARTDFEKCIKINKEFSSNLPEIHLERKRLADTFTSLVQNACEAIIEAITQAIRSEGILTVSSKKLSVDSIPFIEIAISDNGIGISPQDQSKIFDLFYTTKDTGLGFGLWRDRNFIRAIGGDIEMQSEKGKGTTLTVTIPVKRNITTDKVTSENNSECKKLEVDEKENEQKRSKAVLVVDDYDNWRNTISDILKEEYNVISAKNYAEAKQALINQDPPFHAAIVDIRLIDDEPGNESGLELITEINRMGEAINTIVLTGYATIQTQRDALRNLGVFDYIEKWDISETEAPSKIKQIRRIVGNAVENAESRRPRPFIRRGNRILVIEKDEKLLHEMLAILQNEEYEVEGLNTVRSLSECLQKQQYDLIILNSYFLVQHPGLLVSIRRSNVNIPIILVIEEQADDMSAALQNKEDIQEIIIINPNYFNIQKFKETIRRTFAYEATRHIVASIEGVKEQGKLLIGHAYQVVLHLQDVHEEDSHAIWLPPKSDKQAHSVLQISVFSSSDIEIQDAGEFYWKITSNEAPAPLKIKIIPQAVGRISITIDIEQRFNWLGRIEKQVDVIQELSA